MRITSQKGFAGIDQRRDFSNDLSCASEMKNFRVTESGSLTRRQGINYICSMEENIDGIWTGNIFGTEMIVFASGGKLYRLAPDDVSATPVFFGSISKGECMMFEFNGYLYIRCNDFYGKYDGVVLSAVEGYIPLVAMSCTPNGEGELFEEINLITPKRRQQFSSDGSATVYQLAEKDIDKVISVTAAGVSVDNWSCDTSKGTVTFEEAPKEGLNNLEIVYSKAHSEADIKRITGCRRMMLFGGNSDGRIFLWGNDEYPNYRFYSDLADGVPSAEYFPVNAFTIIGNSRINCIVQQYDRQLIFTEDRAFYSYCELRDDGMGNTYASFPVFNLNDGKGCIFETEGCVIDNKPVTLCRDGLNRWESTAVENERNAICFSAPICNAMRDIIGSDNTDMCLFDFQANRELYFICGENAYIYNYGNGSWYMYDEFGGKYHSVYRRSLYFARGNILCAFGNDIECDLERVCLWRSPYITGGNKSGKSDVIGFDVDMHICGASNLRFDFRRSGDIFSHAQELVFDEDTDRFIRVSSRPRLKRAMPFSVAFTDMGPGRTTIHGMTIRTRDKERSERNGVL